MLIERPRLLVRLGFVLSLRHRPFRRHFNVVETGRSRHSVVHHHDRSPSVVVQLLPFWCYAMETWGAEWLLS